MVKKNLFIFFILLKLSFGIGYTQIPIQWAKNYGGSNGDGGRCLAKTQDGGYILVGSSESSNVDLSGNNGNLDYWVVKVNSVGDIQWQKNYGGSGRDFAYAVQTTTDNGYIIAGYSESNNGDVSGNHGTWDYWIVKINSIGLIQWQKSFGGSGEDLATCIEPTMDGGFLIGGYSSSTNGDVSGNNGASDFWIIKIDPLGNIIWQKSIGGINDDFCYSIKPTFDGGYLVAGSSNSNNGNNIQNHGLSDCLIFKLNSLGNVLWNKNYGGTRDDVAWSIKETNDGGFIFLGGSNSNDFDVSGNFNNNQFDFWVVKTNSIGQIQWQRSLGGSNNEIGQSIEIDADGGYLMVGFSSSNDGNISNNHGNYDGWLLKLNNSGTLLWQKSLGGSNQDELECIKLADDGGIVGFGRSISSNGDIPNNYGYDDYWLVKLFDPLCDFSTTISPEINNTTLGANTTFHGYVSNGLTPNLQWQANFGQGFQSLFDYGSFSGTNSEILSIENIQLSYHNLPVRLITSIGNCISVSEVSILKILDTCITTINDTNLITVTDTLLINLIITGTSNQLSSNTIKIFPNPSNSTIFFDYGQYYLLNGFSIELENALGQILFQTQINHALDQLNIGSIGGSGIYYVNIIDQNGNRIDVRKILIQ